MVDGHRFSWALGACAVLAVLLRLGLGQATDTGSLGSDAPFFRITAVHLVDGEGYGLAPAEDPDPTAKHPPAFTLLLAGTEVVGLGSVRGQRAVLAVLGAATVGVLGLAGRRLGGAAVGLLSALIGAVHPLWVQPGVIIMSESLHLFAISLVLLTALRAVDRRRPVAALAAGAALGLAIMVRSEAVLLWLLLAPVIAWAHQVPWRRRGALALAVLAGTVAVVGPWAVRNAVVMGAPTVSTNLGVTLAGGSCDATSEGPRTGGFSLSCSLGSAAAVRMAPSEDGSALSEVELDRAVQRQAIDDIVAHPGRTARQALLRPVRTWLPYQPRDQLAFDVAEGRLPAWQKAGHLVHLALLPVVAVGAVVLARRDRRRAAVVLAPVLQVTLVSMALFGGSRVRAAAEPSIALLAAAGILWTAGAASPLIARHRPAGGWRCGRRPGRTAPGPARRG